MEKGGELPKEEQLASRLNELLADQVWWVVNHVGELLGQRALTFRLPHGVTRISQTCKLDDPSIWINEITVEVEGHNQTFSWMRDEPLPPESCISHAYIGDIIDAGR
jgi:hypothetical protein